ncbi:MAG: prefoldin subunit alpha [archaeon]
MTKNNALEGYQELQGMNQQLQVLQNQLDVLDNQVNELNLVKDSLDNVSKSKGDEEILVPMGAGIYIRGNIKEKTKVIMNVGASVVIEKNIDEALKLVDSQIDEMARIKKVMQEEITDISMNMQKLQLAMQV